MSEPEKKRRFSSIFKSKDSPAKVSSPTSGTGATGTGTGEEEGAQGGRRKLFTQLSEAEKSQRRSTVGSASLLQATAPPPPPQQAQGGQLAAASTNSKGVLFSRNQPAPMAAPELETPFAKMVRQSGTTATARDGAATGALAKQDSNPSNLESGSTGTMRRGSSSTLTPEEKKQRRKSLLAPVQTLFGMSTGDSSTSSAGTVEASVGSSSSNLNNSSGSLDSDTLCRGENKKKKSGGLFGSRREKGLDFQTGLQLDDSQTKVQRERQKKLQKELDKIEKEKAKQEKARQTRLLDILHQTLELGEERAQMPMPGHRSAFALPMRPPIET